jgi:catechol 2,3-dioxygenase-like lactoylglutathione lyase family enzyme
MKVHKISAVTLIIKNMERSCNFYSEIPGFKLVYGGSPDDTFTTYEIGEDVPKICLNLELNITNNYHMDNDERKIQHFGRIIFHTEDVDKLYIYFKSNISISTVISFENEPSNAAWGERYFHIREPDGYQLSFAKPFDKKKNL